MKRFAFLAGISVWPLAALTKVRLGQLNVDQLTFDTTQPVILVCMPNTEGELQNKSLLPVILDKDTLGVFEFEGQFYLRAIGQGSPDVSVWDLTAAQASFSVKSHSACHVYRNGILQSESIDYTKDGTIVTFKTGGIPQPNDIVRFHTWV